MKRSKITSHFEALGSHSVLLVLGAWLILSAHRFPFTTYACAVVFYALVSRDRTWPAAMLILALYLLPTGFSSETMRQGRVITVRDRYAVVTDHGHNMLVYTRSRPILDSTIRFDGIPVLIEPSSGFYKFDFAGFLCDP